MNPMYKAQLFAVIRALMLAAGASGQVNISNTDLDTLVNAALIAGSVIWSLVQKWRVNRKLQEARAGV